MSQWAWVGSWFPGMEGVVNDEDTGNGTKYPVTWTHRDLCVQEWKMLEMEWHISGSMELTFTDGMTSEPQTGSFDETFTFRNLLAPAGPQEWNILEPDDYSAGASNSFTPKTQYGSAFSIPFTTSYGDVTVFVTTRVALIELYVVKDDLDTYTKYVELSFFCGGSIAPGIFANTLLWSTWANVDIAGLGVPLPLVTDGGDVDYLDNTITSFQGSELGNSDAVTFVDNTTTWTDDFDKPGSI